jgi:hypothetical protein
MPLGDLSRALRSSYHVPGRPHTFAQPTIYQWDAVIGTARYSGNHSYHCHPAAGRRIFDRLAGFVPGGVHLTQAAFVPTSLLKVLTGTHDTGTINLVHLLALDRAGLDREQARLYRLEDEQCLKEQTDPAAEVTDVAIEVPWALACAQDRFPYWFGQPDPRNGLLAELLKGAEALQKGARQRRSHSNRLFSRSSMPVPDTERNNTSVRLYGHQWCAVGHINF